jgi:hypothetical protein
VNLKFKLKFITQGIQQIFSLTSLKRIMKKSFYLLFLVLLCSCHGAREISVQVKRPARITIPANIQSVGLLNRSLSGTKAGLEGAITLETPNRDKTLAGECLRGMRETIGKSERFYVVTCDTTLPAPVETSLGFGELLDWAMIDSLCKFYKVDAILTVEFFDSDFSVHNPAGAATQALGSILTGNQQTIEVRGTASAQAGFRIYHSLTKSMLYENSFQHKTYYTQRSYSVAEAMSKLIKRNDALREVSYATGRAFGQDIVPLFYWERRKIFKKGHDQMKRGYRQAQSKNWTGAKDTWMALFTDASKRKTRAKAACNVALAYEVLGDLISAQKWVQEAYAEKGMKIILRYSDLLDQRILEQEKLKEQETK